MLVTVSSCKPWFRKHCVSLTLSECSTCTVPSHCTLSYTDYDKMIKGDAGMEDIYSWTPDAISEDFRGATFISSLGPSSSKALNRVISSKWRFWT